MMVIVTRMLNSFEDVSMNISAIVLLFYPNMLTSIRCMPVSNAPLTCVLKVIPCESEQICFKGAT